MTAITLKSAVLERLTDEEFYQFCMDNRDQRIERDANHQITIMPPTNSETGASNSEINYQLAHWNRQHELGKTFDSSAGFTLDTGAMLSPDASWIAWENWNALSLDDRRGFARICPDFVVELLSPTDRLTDTMRKMEHWLEAGAKLGWLIAPGTESVYIFEPGQPVRPVVGFDQELVAGSVLPGFVLELRRLRAE
ncbi:Uma2 family endonuclease [Hymenobacter sp. DH14]|uniref:Uma2 family endonuclease n=1 Tax=Hymenobacter cyanobacteriorum TaxID=2926463 RepID=A0A9X2AJU3_9BACT|nr:Uma2 family endonuclease [Hymenobacter cyanobacteriorum]MCI1189234.1 Uma2 family endonuclease [Hymenobacter cyanobacteriorum]